MHQGLLSAQNQGGINVHIIPQRLLSLRVINTTRYFVCSKAEKDKCILNVPRITKSSLEELIVKLYVGEQHYLK